MALGINDVVLGRGIAVNYRNPAGTGSYLPLGFLVSLDGPGVTVGEVETPGLSNTMKLYASTLPEIEGTINIRFNNLNPAVQAFRALMKAAPIPVVDLQFVYPDGYTDALSGFPKGFTVSGGENETVLMAAIPFRAVTPITTTTTPTS